MTGALSAARPLEHFLHAVPATCKMFALKEWPILCAVRYSVNVLRFIISAEILEKWVCCSHIDEDKVTWRVKKCPFVGVVSVAGIHRAFY